MSEPLPLDPGRILAEIARLLASSFGEIVPPEAQLHLLNAQRELLLALAVIIEHNGSRSPRRPRGQRGPGADKTGRRPQRVELD